MRRTVRWTLGLAAVAAGLGSAALALRSPRDGGIIEAGLTLLVGWSFIGAGLAACARRPRNRVGPLMVALGFAWFVAGLDRSQDAWLFTVGLVLQELYLALGTHLLLAFPTGRLDSRVARVVVVGVYLACTVVQLLGLLVQPPCPGCPENLLLVAPNPALAETSQGVQVAIGLALAGMLVVILVARWRLATVAARRAGAPVVWSGGVAVVLIVVLLFNEQLNLGLNPAARWLFLAAFACVPLGFLASLLQTRLARASVAKLVVQLGAGVAPGALRDALARSLGDPSLALAYWMPDQQRYVDLHGQAVELPSDSRGIVTLVEHEGQRVAALVHDPALREDPELVEAVGAAAALALDNERLHAELRARVKELAQSRARLVEAADAERRRIERNLHDGIQQRLVSISMALGLADAKIRGDPDAARDVLAEAKDALAAALEELRTLSQGIHPAILTERGLKVALDELAWTAALPVTVACDLDGRLPEPVEATAYYVVAEALANVAKHAQATAARVAVDRLADRLAVQVTDDGAGGADPARGSGLSGLADRVEVLGGMLQIVSPLGGGTTLRAELPCA